MATSSHLLRLYTIGIGIVCAGSVAYTLQSQHDADRARRNATAWQREVLAWQDTARQAMAGEKDVRAQNADLVERFNALVNDTKASERKLLASLEQARKLAKRNRPIRYVSGGTTYRYASAAGGSATSAASGSPATGTS